MKRISIPALILYACNMPIAWAQAPPSAGTFVSSASQQCADSRIEVGRCGNYGPRFSAQTGRPASEGPSVVPPVSRLLCC